MNWIAAIGWCAGGLVMLSGLPNIVRNLRATGPPAPTILRDLMQLAGNLAWVAYGALTGATPIAAMCGLNACFMLVLIAQQLRRARQQQAIQSLESNRKEKSDACTHVYRRVRLPRSPR